MTFGESEAQNPSHHRRMQWMFVSRARAMIWNEWESNIDLAKHQHQHHHHRRFTLKWESARLKLPQGLGHPLFCSYLNISLFFSLVWILFGETAQQSDDIHMENLHVCRTLTKNKRVHCELVILSAASFRGFCKYF